MEYAYFAGMWFVCVRRWPANNQTKSKIPSLQTLNMVDYFAAYLHAACASLTSCLWSVIKVENEWNQMRDKRCWKSAKNCDFILETVLLTVSMHSTTLAIYRSDIKFQPKLAQSRSLPLLLLLLNTFYGATYRRLSTITIQFIAVKTGWLPLVFLPKVISIRIFTKLSFNYQSSFTHLQP